MTQSPRILHLHSSFNPGGKELRAVQLINAFGKNARHSVVSAMPWEMGAAAKVKPGIAVDYPEDFPPLQGRVLPGRLHRIASAMQPFDLVLTYNFGAMDAVLARTMFSLSMPLPPLIHHEDGFNADEMQRRHRNRNWYRRLGLAKAAAVVVCSEGLERIARDEWRVPAGRIVRIANGIPTKAYAGTPAADALPRVIKRRGEFWLGTLAGLRPVKNLPRLVRAFAGLPEAWQLVILGQGSEAEVIRDEALRLNIGHRVHLPGHVADPARVIGLFDLFALSSDSEQAPISVIEAMAAGLAVAATDVGDTRAMLSEDNRRFVVPVDDEAALAAALAELAGDAALRRRLGQANQARARAEFDEARMIGAYRALYSGVLGRPV